MQIDPGHPGKRIHSTRLDSRFTSKVKFIIFWFNNNILLLLHYWPFYWRDKLLKLGILLLLPPPEI